MSYFSVKVNLACNVAQHVSFTIKLVSITLHIDGFNTLYNYIQ